ncbi:MAG: ethanolamine utilization protein EutQ [Thermoleophilaceae bacterium]|jgi:ethanolamine utilization protein EutQ (cupin superfamily)|nr:ethanolamine utilization protein EutQ [Thermoleophilaceae bacterium]
MAGIQFVAADEFTWGSLGAQSAEQDSLAEVLTLNASPETPGTPGIGCGITELRALEAVYPLTFDEVAYVIEGEVHISDGENSYVARAGDVFSVGYGTQLQLSVPDHARVFYAAYPANWSALRPGELEKLSSATAGD